MLTMYMFRIGIDVLLDVLSSSALRISGNRAEHSAISCIGQSDQQTIFSPGRGDLGGVRLHSSVDGEVDSPTCNSSPQNNTAESPPLEVIPLLIAGPPGNRNDLVFFSDGCACSTG